MLEKTKQYAIGCHDRVNQKYGNKPYSFHLNMVYEVAQEFSCLIPKEELENTYCGCWVHDLIEDARETYNDVLYNTNKTIAELAYALTNEKGRTRIERANDRYYQGIRETPNATFIKLCDRIANVRHSKTKGSTMLDKYRKENTDFAKKLYRPDLQEMFDHLEELFK
ncbi:phosphohydrolase [uncultured Croceitalea sp.]|uniref:phosphohydrolase n=1 Tax=uncultured Croceitalea sp. TaxID=1798908 RepID=UPI0033064370